VYLVKFNCILSITRILTFFENDPYTYVVSTLSLSLGLAICWNNICDCVYNSEN